MGQTRASYISPKVCSVDPRRRQDPSLGKASTKKGDCLPRTILPVGTL